MSAPATTTTAGELLDSSTAWLRTHLSWFDPWLWARYLPERAFFAQPTLELLLLTRVLGEDHELTAPALRMAASVVDGAKFRERLEQPDDLLRYWVYLLGLLHSGGHPRPELVALAGTALRANFPDLAPLLPVEHLELRYALDLAGLPGPLGTAAELTGTALDDLDSRADALTEVDAYSLTHLVLYATDMGARPLPVDPAPVRRMVRRQLAEQVAAGDHDLTAELVHCARIAGLADDSLVRHALLRLLSARHLDGAVPSPPYDPAVAARLRRGELVGYRFATRYHTTLTCALAAADLVVRA
jgi:hypothetical protein